MGGLPQQYSVKSRIKHAIIIGFTYEKYLLAF